jgi:hypothetical protein
VQAPGVGSLLNGSRGKSQLAQLVERHDRVLPRRARGNRRPNRGLAEKASAFFAFSATPSVHVGHRLIVALET